MKAWNTWERVLLALLVLLLPLLLVPLLVLDNR